MSSIGGKMTNALASLTNENNLSLANLNVELALVKVQPPAEFQSIGKTLSIHRRDVAEDGTYHRTARCLGALFSNVIPSTPKLIKAFGIRVSEILKYPQANPRGTAEDGPFREYVGADATSIWASATSGIASIAVLLLACMLARKFQDSRHSISIWVEIVQVRQEELSIEAQTKGSLADAVAAQQRILREDLVLFDDSVRAWLITADSVMAKKRKQLDLIVENLTSMPVSVGNSSYSKILQAWKDAMTGFEALLDGKPQNATNSSVLLALSAWNLYPNLIVLSQETVKVNFCDELFPETGALTVGLHYSTEEAETPGFRWSLALSHLKYYGDPVTVDVDSDNIRINMQEFLVIAFGSLLRKWGIAPTYTSTVAEWVMEIASQLKDAQGNPASMGETYLWFEGICAAAKASLSLLHHEKERCEKLLKYGRRRAENLFQGPANYDRPFLGLSNPYTLHAMLLPPSLERSVHYVRSVAGTFGYEWSAILSYQHACTICNCSTEILATVKPHRRWSAKRSENGIRKAEEVHFRWVFLSDQVLRGLSDEAIMSHMTLPASENVLIYRGYPEDFYWAGSQSPALNESKPLFFPDLTMRWHLPAYLYLCSNDGPTCATTSEGTGVCSCLNLHMTLPDQWIDNTATFKLEFMDREKICLYSRDQGYPSAYPSDRPQLHPCTSVHQSAQHEFCRTLKPEATLVWLKEHKLHPKSLTDYFDQLTNSRSGGLCTCKANKSDPKCQLQDYGRSLLHVDDEATRFCEWTGDLSILNMGQGDISFGARSFWSSVKLLSMIYDQLPGATFPIKIFDSSFPQFTLQAEARTDFETTLTRSTTLSYIATMESGGVYLSPANFDRAFAISIGNSLYVAKSVLEDPRKETPSHAVTRIIGNLGRPGMSILISPDDPKVKKITEFHAVEHAAYDWKSRNSFKSISLHLSLTEWRVPCQHKSFGLIDQDIFFSEAVISVHSYGKWYADIDILKALDSAPRRFVKLECDCQSQDQNDFQDEQYTSIENLDELLDPPVENAGIVRAFQDWAARLATYCIVFQKIDRGGALFVVEDAQHCLRCLPRQESATNPNIRKDGDHPIILIE